MSLETVLQSRSTHSSVSPACETGQVSRMMNGITGYSLEPLSDPGTHKSTKDAVGQHSYGLCNRAVSDVLDGDKLAVRAPKLAVRASTESDDVEEAWVREDVLR
jgi:hypothetical protein